MLIYLGPVTGFSGAILIARLLTPNPLIWMAETAVINDRIGLVLLILAVTAALAGFWNARSDPRAREQLRWVFGGFLLSLGLLFLLNVLPKLLGGSPILQREASGLLALPFVLGIAVAILRYHLFDIDILINRTLVYGALTAIVVLGYVGVVGLLGRLFEVQGNIWISLVVTGLVAVLFQPLRERVQHGVNRLMYGERDAPYTVLARLSRRLGAALTPDMILPMVVETIAQALKLPYAAIAYEQDGEHHIAAEYGLIATPLRIQAGVGEEEWSYPKEYLNIPLAYRSEELGRLILAPRARGDAFTPADIRFLEEVASQAGAVVYTVKLTEDLQRSREKLVTTREEERRRLRRDLHDGIGSILASLAFNLDAATNLLDRDPVATGALIKELKVQTQTAMADIRRLAYDLRPPVLDELGFVASLQEYIKGVDLPPDLCIEFNPPKDLRALPAAVEVAAYRISVEALKNVIRHAQAHTCTVNVTMNAMGSLEVAIIDDGQGLPVGWHAGVGISAMRERALELGGTFEVRPNARRGTRVMVMLPLAKE
jgi:signal transduction histidine kinase